MKLPLKEKLILQWISSNRCVCVCAPFPYFISYLSAVLWCVCLNWAERPVENRSCANTSICPLIQYPQGTPAQSVHLQSAVAVLATPHSEPSSCFKLPGVSQEDVFSDTEPACPGMNPSLPFSARVTLPTAVLLGTVKVLLQCTLSLLMRRSAKHAEASPRGTGKQFQTSC